jgi:hypothetical protein
MAAAGGMAAAGPGNAPMAASGMGDPNAPQVPMKSEMGMGMGAAAAPPAYAGVNPAMPPQPAVRGSSSGGGMATAMAMPVAGGIAAMSLAPGAGPNAPSMAAGGMGAPAVGASGTGESVRAVYAYRPAKADELELRPGDVVTVTKKNDDGWYVGYTADGRAGAFPSNYVTSFPGQAATQATM